MRIHCAVLWLALYAHGLLNCVSLASGGQLPMADGNCFPSRLHTLFGMNPLAPTHSSPHPLLVYYHDADANTPRKRSLGLQVRTGKLELPPLPARLLADWQRDIATQLDLQIGDVEELSLVRTRARWPGYSRAVQAVDDWLSRAGMPAMLAGSPVALMACRGARYHHDAAQYGGAAFCNLFLSEDRGLDLHCAASGHRIALVAGTLVLFDPSQPHAVIARGSAGFDVRDFADGPARDLVFLTWELPLGHPAVARALGVVIEGEGAR